MKKPLERPDSSLNTEERRIVLDAALSVLSRGGFTANIVEKVAEKCALSAPRIFLHFGGTEKLLAAILDRQLELIAGSVSSPELRFPGETLHDELVGLARNMVEVLRSHLGVLRAMFGEALRNPEFAPVFYRTFILRGRNLFADFLRERAKRGELRPEVDVEAAAAAFLTSLIMSLLLMELFGGKEVEQFDDERLTKSMTELFLNGVLPRPA